MPLETKSRQNKYYHTRIQQKACKSTQGKIPLWIFWRLVTKGYDTLRKVTTVNNTLRHVTKGYDRYQYVTTRYDTLRPLPIRYDTLRHVTTRYERLPI